MLRIQVIMYLRCTLKMAMLLAFLRMGAMHGKFYSLFIIILLLFYRSNTFVDDVEVCLFYIAK